MSLANSKPGDKGDGLRRPSAAESWEGLPKSSPAQPMAASGLEGKIWATRLVRDGCSPHSRLGVQSPRWTRTMTDWRAAPTYHTTAGVIRGPRCFARLQLRRLCELHAALQLCRLRWGSVEEVVEMDVTHPTSGRMVLRSRWDVRALPPPFAVAWQVASSTSDQGRVATRQVLVGGTDRCARKGKRKRSH